MKRSLAILIMLLVLAALPLSGSVLASSADADEQYGLYTQIPYVPKYDGELTSQSRVILMDLETGNMLIEQNGDVRAYPASTTKIMTAVLLIENTADNEWDVPLPPLTEVNSEESVKGSQFGLKVGDQPTRRDLLYGIMLPSGCDCAYVTSCLIAGTEADFVFMMNTRASEIGMNNTGYENSYGLASNGHYTTAEDMATLVRHAMQYKMFRDACSTESKTLHIKNGSGTRTMSTRNTNYLLRHDSQYYYKYAIGVKTGTATIADHCLTSAARKNGLELIAIVMNSDSNSERYTFSREILEWGFDFYASEGGYYSMTVTNAFFKAGAYGCGVYDVPDSALGASPNSTLPAGTGIRVGAYRYDDNGALWYMIWMGSGYKWAKSTELEFVSYVNDIKADIGSSLSGVTVVGTDPRIDGVIASRHLVKAVTITVYDENGSPVTGGSNYPAASCTHTLLGTTVDMDVDIGRLPAGKYTCVTHVEAAAYVPDAPDREYYTVDEKSTLLIVDAPSGAGLDGEPIYSNYAYSYNANTGIGAPDGGIAETGKSFTVSSETPAKPGCVFAGWNTSPDGSGETYLPGDEVTRQSSVTLYALWNEGSDEWQNNIDVEIVDGSLNATGSLTNTAGITTCVVSVAKSGSATPAFERRIACPVNTVTGDDIITLFEDIDFTDGSYTVAIDAASGAGEESRVFEKAVEYSSEVKYELVLVLNGGTTNVTTEGLTVVQGEPFGVLPTPYKDGATFEGWYDNNEQLVTEDTVVPESSNGVIVLHANWMTADNGSQHGSNDDNQSNLGWLAKIPLWVFLAAGLAVAGGLIALIIVIIRSPGKDDGEDE